MAIKRYSSRREPLDRSFFTQRLKNAQAYDRIAGYFSSSILEVAGEALESVQGMVRLVCNSELCIEDIESAKAAQAAMRQEWCRSEPEKLGELSKSRFRRLYDFLTHRKIQIKVLPDKAFGLIHGKAGVITLDNGKQIAFMGSVNESLSAWTLNYELLWEDDSPEAVAWVQEEFDALWTSPFAVPLSEFIIHDIGRLSRRQVVATVEEWNKDPDPAAPVIESPVYRKESGLSEHQKYFIVKAFDAHLSVHGARFVLADQVGLGKTLQLAMASQLMALTGGKPVLILAPKPLLWQWQDEMSKHLDMPSAVWNGKQWVDERGIEYPVQGHESIRHCPRCVGIVSTGLITSQSEICDWLLTVEYECVIVDEAHRARRKNLSPGREYGAVEPNNLLSFLYRLSCHTKSMMMATATPVQLHPVEAWDLLDVLSRGSDAVLGTVGSRWRKPQAALELIMNSDSLHYDDIDMWEWIRNPLPPASESSLFSILRRSLKLTDSETYAPGKSFEYLKLSERTLIRRNFKNFIENYNPFIRHIVIRTRHYLENTVDPQTGEPYLKPVSVILHGESGDDAIRLPLFLEEAYKLAEQFCQLLANRVKSGFFQTLLLRRIGSTMEAGRLTVQKMLHTWDTIDNDDDDDNDTARQLCLLTSQERAILERLMKTLEAHRENDPKYAVIRNLLIDNHWLNSGCIIFSQYLDSLWWLANQLTRDLPDEIIALYAGAHKSGIIHQGSFTKTGREEIKNLVQKREIRLILGTDAASEGLNLQRLGRLINLDLPWNPTRLEQRKGRIQRIGQVRDRVHIYNMRYAGSVEDRVHELLSQRLEAISQVFGQVPDIVEDIWIEIAMGNIKKAEQTIDAVPLHHPFQLRYHKVEKVNWESCTQVLNAEDRRQFLMKGWKS